MAGSSPAPTITARQKLAKVRNCGYDFFLLEIASEPMDEQRRGKRHTQFSRATRGKRILDRLREGWAYDEVAREEGLTERRVGRTAANILKIRTRGKGGPPPKC